MEGGRTIGRPDATKSWPSERDVIRQGTASDAIVAGSNGTNLSLTVNGVLIALAENDTFSSGSIGPVAKSYEPESTGIRFDNLVITAP